jgi:hypothetical protein
MTKHQCSRLRYFYAARIGIDFPLLLGFVLGHPLLVLGLALRCLFLRLFVGSGCAPLLYPR